VYIAEARTGRFYVGMSTDPEERITEHNQGRGAYFAKLQGPFSLMYTSSAYSTKAEAAKREKQLKGWTREKKEKLISGEWV
jgi:predicted GIY-YIG superfamily endonuclease